MLRHLLIPTVRSMAIKIHRDVRASMAVDMVGSRITTATVGIITSVIVKHTALVGRLPTVVDSLAATTSAITTTTTTGTTRVVTDTAVIRVFSSCVTTIFIALRVTAVATATVAAWEFASTKLY